MGPSQPGRQAKLLSSEGLTADEEEAREHARRFVHRQEDPGNASLFACPVSGAPAEEDYPLLTPEQVEEHRRKMAEILSKIGSGIGGKL